MEIKFCPNCGSSLINKSGVNGEKKQCTICKAVFPKRLIPVSDDEKEIAKKARIERQELIVQTYLNLSEAIERAFGSVVVLEEYRNKPLKEFLEDVCARNGIRFVFNIDKRRKKS